MGIHGYCSEQVITHKFIVDAYQYLKEKGICTENFFALLLRISFTAYSQCPPRFQHLAAACCICSSWLLATRKRLGWEYFKITYFQMSLLALLLLFCLFLDKFCIKLIFWILLSSVHRSFFCHK